MQRRNFLQLLSALPLLGWLKPEPQRYFVGVDPAAGESASFMDVYTITAGQVAYTRPTGWGYNMKTFIWDEHKCEWTEWT